MAVSTSPRPPGVCLFRDVFLYESFHLTIDFSEFVDWVVRLSTFQSRCLSVSTGRRSFGPSPTQAFSLSASKLEFAELEVRPPIDFWLAAEESWPPHVEFTLWGVDDGNFTFAFKALAFDSRLLGLSSSLSGHSGSVAF